MGRAILTACVACAITCGCAFVLMTLFATPLERAGVEPSVVGLLPVLLTDRLYQFLFAPGRRSRNGTGGANGPGLRSTEAVLAAASLWLVIVVAQAVGGNSVDTGWGHVITYDVPVVAAVAAISVWASRRFEREAVLAVLLCCGCSLTVMSLLDVPLRQIHLQPLVEGFGLIPILLLDSVYESLRLSAQPGSTGQSPGRSRRWGARAVILAILLYVGYSVSSILVILSLEGGRAELSARDSATSLLILLLLGLVMGLWSALRYGTDDLRIAWTACLIGTIVPFVLIVASGAGVVYGATGQGAWCVSTMSASWVGCVLGRRLRAQRTKTLSIAAG